MNSNRISFAEGLKRVRDMLSILRGFVGFNPPRTTESIDGIRAFIDTLVIANTNVTNLNGEYRLAVGNRKSLFYTDDNSVVRIFANIMLYIKAQYGKDSTEYAILDTIMDKMRTTRLSVATTEGTEGEPKRKYSYSSRSYGTMTQNFHDFITTVLTFDGYNPAEDDYKPEGLTILLGKINAANDDVATKRSNLKVAKDDRRALYNELSDRSARIRSYVKYKYGKDSTEDSQIRSNGF